MLNWFIAVFGLLGFVSRLLFDINVMLLVNLPLIAATRGAYIVGYYLNYGKYSERDLSNPAMHAFSTKEKAYFAIKNATVIFIGFLNIYLAIFLGLYSLMIAALYFKNLGLRINNSNMALLGELAYIIAPICFTLIYLFIDLYAIIPIAISLVLFVVRGLVYGNYSISKLFHRYGRRIFNVKKYTHIGFKKFMIGFRYFMMVFLVVSTFTLILGLSLWGNPSKETHMVRMSDGTRLATDVYFSPLVGKNPAPVILVRTPYGKGDFMDAYAVLYSNQGYHVVVQDFRGCFNSEGGDDFLLFTKDYMDGPETIEWILDQSWSNGLVASAGISALCITQYLYAPTAPEELKCQSLWFGTPDLIEDAILEGAFHEGLVYFWIKGVAPDNWRTQMDIIYEHMTDLSLLSGIEARSVSLEEAPNAYETVRTRALHVGGFYDHFLKGTIRGYMNYDDRGAERARGHQKMIIGPWTHGMVFTGEQGELSYPANSIGVPQILEWESEIFDESLLGADKDIWSGNRVAYYLMGDLDDPTADANYWKYAKDWPLNFTWNKWYLGVDENGIPVVVDNSSDLDGYHELSYEYDPLDPISTRGGNNEPFYTDKGAGPMDQRPVEEEDGKLRDDLLLFQSDVFDEPYTVEGDLKVTLFIKSTAIDTDFMVKLCDVYPDGRRMLIIDSALTTRYRLGHTSENFLTPGKEYEITIDLAATAYQFNEGHRIAVTIQSSNYDRFSINPNTGGPITQSFADSLIAENTVITGPGKSCVWFPELRG